MSAGSVAEKIRRYEKDPIYFLSEEFGVTPEPYQYDAMMAFCDPGYPTRKVVMRSSAGTGKTATIAWCALWAMLTKVRKSVWPKGVAVSMSRPNLEAGLWPELGRWLHESRILKELFEINQKRLSSREKGNLFNITARTYDPNSDREAAGRVLSGLHGPVLLYLVDESGSIVPTVGKSIDQGFGEKGAKFVRMITAGNPATKDSLLFAESEAAKRQGNKKVWAISITSDPDDPKRSSRVDPQWAKDLIEDHGRNDPWVKCYVFGEFPDTAFTTLLDEEEVERAMNREVPEDKNREVFIGFDAARFGADSNVICPRRGLTVYPLREIKSARTGELVDAILRAIDRFGEGTVNVDGTGGYGSGVVDMMLERGYYCNEINFGSSAGNEEKFFNKRSEMYFKMAEWIKRAGKLPRDAGLKKELSNINYTFDEKGRFKLESKEQIRKRTGSSPDKTDALALGFAVEESFVADRIGDDDVQRGDDRDIYERFDRRNW